MRPPVKKPLNSNPTDAPQVESHVDSGREGLAEKRKLAQHLHDQGVNPLTWTDAHPAPQAAQLQFQETGRKPRDNQFEIAGRLYDWTPSVSATPAQAKAIADAYAATPHDPAARRSAPVETLVDIAKVPLRHPLGTPHMPRAAANENDPIADEARVALYRHYARSSIDPDKAHLGDPLPMREQEKLKAEMAKLLPGDKTEISGLPMFYQGFDDGWIYQPNASTQESEEVRKMRLEFAKHSSEGAALVTNENGAAIESEIARFYQERHLLNEGNAKRDREDGRNTLPAQNEKQAEAVSPLQSSPQTPTDDDLDKLAMNRLREGTAHMPKLIATIRKMQSGKHLTEEEEVLLVDIKERFAGAGIEFDPNEADPKNLEALLKIMQAKLDRGPSANSRIPFHVAIDQLNLEITQSLIGSTVAAARVTKGMPLDRLKAIGRLVLESRLKLPAKALLTTLNADRAMDGPVEVPDVFEGAEDDIQASYPSEGQVRDPGKTGAEPKLETMSLQKFRESLAYFDEVAIHIGDVVLVQHPHTTATDQIIIEAIVDVASSRGCDPEPDPTSPREDGKSIYGGTKGSQSRITDIGQPGHRGSAQPDATTNLSGHGNKGAIYVNTASTKADLITPIARELASAQQILRNTEKQLAADPRALEELRRAITRPGHVWVDGKKWGWELDRIRRHVRRKVQELYDQLYKDCLPIGEPGIFPLDDPNDPEFRE